MSDHENDNGQALPRPDRDRLALAIVKHLEAHGFRALYAGGYVRDMLLGSADKGDIDIATDARPQQIASLFPRVLAVGEHFGVMIVVSEGIPFEVATFRSDIGTADGRHPREVVFCDPRTDAQRRDFTINGMFFDPVKHEVLDYVGGRRDLDSKTIRAIGEPGARFDEDYLRLLRAVRFSARFGFAVEEATWNALREKAGGICGISAERVFQELDKMLRGPQAGRAIEMLHEAGLLALVLPEVEATRGVEQPPEFHPEGDVFTHTVRALSLLDKPSQPLAWSTLLHDIGKPPTLEIRDRIRFNNHHRVGAVMAGVVMRRLKASSELIERITAIIDNHMNFVNVRQMRLSTLKKFLARATFDDELQMHRVDCLSSHGDLSNFEFLRDKSRELSREVIAPPPLLRGRDLLALGMRPGPKMGEVLQMVYDLQLDEQITERDEALAWVERNVLGEQGM